MAEVLQEHFGAGTVQVVGSLAELEATVIDDVDMILADYNLPDCCGLDLLRAVRTRGTVPVIMVTGENVGEIAAEAIRCGATDYVVKTGELLHTIPLVVEKNLTTATLTKENEKLRRELEHALGNVQDTNAQLAHSLRQVEELAATDPLTGLYNRRYFGNVLTQLFHDASRGGDDLSCVMIDIDRYKQLNDSLGHQVGDDLLVLLAKVIKSNLRQMDVAARYGGDEFVLLLPHAHAEEAAAVATRIATDFQNSSGRVLGTAGCTLSMGVSSMEISHAASTEQLLGGADKALYAAKEGGRARVAIQPRERALAS